MAATSTGNGSVSSVGDDATKPPLAGATAEEVAGDPPSATGQPDLSGRSPPPPPPASPPGLGLPPAPPAPPSPPGGHWFTTGKVITLLATILVLVGLASIVTFTLQIYPFKADRVEACELVDEVSDKLGKVDAASAIRDYNKYLADRDMKKVMMICEIERASGWYGRVSITNQILLSIGSVLVVVLTLATSFILGAGWVEKTPSLKPVTVALPLISAAITATISEFHLSDVWQLREIGKIESRLLLSGLYDLGTDDVEFDRKLQDIKVSLAGLEKNQAERYFAYKFQTTANNANKKEDAPAKPPAKTDETKTKP